MELYSKVPDEGTDGPHKVLTHQQFSSLYSSVLKLTTDSSS